ncbi:MAG TPA: hypothetical protein VM925_26740 [Labilithrix sp.]|nr:hypothetical protein [Labilithrix sp.]
MAKYSAPPLTDEEADAPTRKLSVPAGLREQHSTVPAPSVSTKLRKSEIDELLKERAKSGTRPAVSEDERDRYERREMRETVPAPADDVEAAEDVAQIVFGTKR